jgi:hypothetical protein
VENQSIFAGEFLAFAKGGFFIAENPSLAKK